MNLSRAFKHLRKTCLLLSAVTCVVGIFYRLDRNEKWFKCHSFQLLLVCLFEIRISTIEIEKQYIFLIKNYVEK
jgi:hypothetical protein